jgi:hypothetical protein
MKLHQTARTFLLLFFAGLLFLGLPLGATEYGPYHGIFIPDGLGLKKSFDAPNAPIQGFSQFTMSCWLRSDEAYPQSTLVAGFGELTTAPRTQRYFALLNGRPALWLGLDGLSSPTAFKPGEWHHVALTFDGATARLYSDGLEVASSLTSFQQATPLVLLGPQPPAGTGWTHFGGRVAFFNVVDRVLKPAEIQALMAQAGDLDSLAFEPASRSWPVQLKAQPGLLVPQDPVSLPQSTVPPSKPVARPEATVPVLAARGPNQWVLAGGWKLAVARKIPSTGADISEPGFDTKGWWGATVPGTVLTTLIDRGVYPDPDYGLNNLAIPETLARQDYWYRTEFTAPASLQGRRLTLTFNGINYAAAVWVNGRNVGNIKGAFIRGVFDVTSLVKIGKPNTVAVLISPPPHPGVPNEKSNVAGPGPNGGMLLLDGPTFFCTEGWDWIPGIRDRDTGIWQDVILSDSGAVKIGDAQVVTKLPLPAIDRANVTLAVPLRNDTGTAVNGTLIAEFEGVRVQTPVSVSPGETTITLTPSQFPQLSVANPRLWWPNGYGKPNLYHLTISFTGAKGESDRKIVRFGMREISYEMSLLDDTSRIRRVEYSPAEDKGRRLVNVSHEGLIQTAEGFVPSLMPAAESSNAIRSLADRAASPYLIIRVNGVRIAIKGGNWGISDSRKRVSRERMEPYIRLTRDAHFTMIRNWAGQSMEEELFELCDEYGILVWNDFWGSTQDHSLEPADVGLLLGNARDAVLRFRNHPSIVIWCGENEGVPNPVRNEGLEAIVREVDGTRYYSPNSRLIDLAQSGPWRHGEPVDFFTERGRGFTTELGLPSPPTIDTLRAMLPAASQWPPNDTWAYHDWHSTGNGDVSSFMKSMGVLYGPPVSLEDFNRKAQMINYVNHRAMFEGFNAHLWAPNTGRLMWMSHPAWPSMNWQAYSADYDPSAAYYGLMKACEPVHIQLNLPDLKTAVINNTVDPLPNLTMRIRIFALDGRLVADRSEKVSVGGNTTAEGGALPDTGPAVVFVKLELRDPDGKLLSENFYWQAPQPDAFRQLSDLAAMNVLLSATRQSAADSTRVTVTLSNPGEQVAVMNHVTLRLASTGTRVLPAYASDNYVALLPGETRQIVFESPTIAAANDLQVELTGWNTRPATAVVTAR